MKKILILCMCFAVLSCLMITAFAYDPADYSTIVTLGFADDVNLNLYDQYRLCENGAFNGYTCVYTKLNGTTGTRSMTENDALFIARNSGSYRLCLGSSTTNGSNYAFIDAVNVSFLNSDNNYINMKPLLTVPDAALPLLVVIEGNPAGTVLDSMIEMWNEISEFLVSSFDSLQGLFWDSTVNDGAGALTFLGVLSVVAVGIALIWLIIAVISKFLHLGG